jgi:Mrp family chromosome partitioning ATPase
MEQTVTLLRRSAEMALRNSISQEENAAGLLATQRIPEPQSNRISMPPSDTSQARFLLEDVRQLDRDPPNPSSRSLFETDPSGVAAEQFRLMRRRLVNVRPNGSSVLLTSPSTSDGKSLNAHNLAWALSEAGRNTLLLDLDLRRPTQAKYMRSRLAPSIEEVLLGEVPAQSAVRQIKGLPLFFLGLNDAARNPTELIRSEALQRLLLWARYNFTWVILDAPPVLPVADVEELLPQVDLVLMIVRERVTSCAMLKHAVERLGQRLHYMIFNDVAGTTGYEYGWETSYPAPLIRRTTE